MKNMNNNPNFTITAESATRALITINKLDIKMELENRCKKRKYSEIMLIDEIYLFYTNPFSKFPTKIKQISKNKESEEK